MLPRKQQALVDLCGFHDPDPAVVFQRVLEVMAAEYGGTMAMINLLDGDVVRFRAVVNPHPLMTRYSSLALPHTYCQFCLGHGSPVLIQDAATDARCEDHPAVRWGFTRYLGVPVSRPTGETIGTLCFVDNRSHELIGELDVQFLSMLAMRASAELERERMIEARIAEEQATAAQLAELNAQLLQTAEEKRRFVATVIHDLRQSVAAIRTLLFVLAQQDDAVERADCQRILNERILSLNEMVDELLEYVRIEASQKPPELEAVELSKFLARLTEEFQPDAQLRQVQLDVDVAGLGMAMTDPTRLSQVVRNLLGNAIKFTVRDPAEDSPAREPGWVAVRARDLDGSRWQLQVEDNGIGIAGEYVPRIFEEFYQAPQAHACEVQANYPRGWGLGLAIVKHSCTSLGATVEVSLRLEGGTCFSLTFPR